MWLSDLLNSHLALVLAATRTVQSAYRRRPRSRKQNLGLLKHRYLRRYSCDAASLVVCQTAPSAKLLFLLYLNMSTEFNSVIYSFLLSFLSCAVVVLQLPTCSLLNVNPPSREQR